jgi:subtilase family serine protease
MMPLGKPRHRHQHRRRWRGAGRGLIAVAALTLTVATTTAAATAAPATPPSAAASGSATPSVPAGASTGASDACAPASAGWASCMAIVDSAPVPGAHGSTLTRPALATGAVTPQPWMAADLQSAYRLPSALLGARQTIAIVDAYDDPNAASDLAVYRAANGLPACDAAFPCFEKVNQEGQQGDYPSADPAEGWEVEESLDLDMASAICPNCKILLVEADDNSDTSLAAAEDEAAALGANVISNSYAGPEYNGEIADLGAAYDHPGVVITAASGDDGFGVSVPAALPSVIAVGGTSLFPDPGTARGWSETSWTYAGSGCSAYVPKPSWQHDKLCGMRTVADVSAVADPDTPVAIYDTFGYPGWVEVGGTSVATPIIAGVYALAGNAATISPGSYLYAHAGSLFNVTSGYENTSGANGDCGGSYLCTPGPGYNGPTGLGTPDGIGAF